MLKVMDTVQTPHHLPANPDGVLCATDTRWAVLMLHGFTAGPQSVMPWAKALTEAGATVYLPLLSGHGTTVSDLAQTKAGQWRRDVQRALDDLLVQDFDKLAVAGLSMGGTLALDAASHRPVDATLVVNPALSFKLLDRLGVLLSPLFDRVIPTVGPLAGDVHQAGVTEEAYARTPVPAVQELAKLLRTTRRQLRNIVSPVTLYWSPRDHIVPRSSAKILRQAVKPHLLTTVALEQSFHVATLDYDAPTIHRHSISTLSALSGGHREIPRTQRA